MYKRSDINQLILEYENANERLARARNLLEGGDLHASS